MHHIKSLNKEFCELEKEVAAPIKELHNAHCLMVDIPESNKSLLILLSLKKITVVYIKKDEYCVH